MLASFADRSPSPTTGTGEAVGRVQGTHAVGGVEKLGRRGVMTHKCNYQSR